MDKDKKILWFILAVFVQLLILAMVPAKQVYTRMAGKLITIETAPVDPYDIMSGYYVTLSYKISQAGGSSRPSGKVYVVLEESDDGIWSDVSVHDKWPEKIDADQIVIKGKGERWRIKYGIERYYIPEKGRENIERQVRNNRQATKAQIKVDRFGNAALIRLIVKDQIFEY